MQKYMKFTLVSGSGGFPLGETSMALYSRMNDYTSCPTNGEAESTF